MGQKSKRVHVVAAVNAKNVSKTGDLFVIRNVCGVVDGMVMNRVLYPGDQCAKAAPTLEGKVAPVGHPKNDAGQYISANSADALLNAYAGAVCKSARHEGGRTVTDLHIKIPAANAHPGGKKVVEWCEAALNGSNPEPMHVSTGLVAAMVEQAGESDGQAYDRIATNIAYDHLALLPGGIGAGTPEQGVGMFNDGTDDLQEVETFVVNAEPEDNRTKGLLAWVEKLVGNGSADLSFDETQSKLHALLPEGAWLREVFDRYAVWTDRDGRLWKQDYTVASESGSVAFAGQAVEVTRKVKYEPITNRQEGDQVKDKLLAALNAAGIETDGLDESQLLAAYNAHVSASAVAPVQTQLTAANSKLAEFEQAARAAADAELSTLATELAVNSVLKPEDFKAMGLARCKELKALGKTAAPIAVGNAGGQPADEFASYDCNALIDAAAKA
jgi:hypothetical protein